MTSVATALINGSEGDHALPAQERRTLGDLYDRFGSTAYSLAFSITNDRTVAERLVTAAFAQTWRQFQREPRSHGAFFTGLITAVRESAIASRDAAYSARVSFESSHERAGPGAIEAAVRSALNDLPDAQKRVLALAYFSGLGVGDIASELGEPMNHVKANLQAALRHLRKVLAAHPSGTVPA